jgi:hypothetical protein
LLFILFVILWKHKSENDENCYSAGRNIVMFAKKVAWTAPMRTEQMSLTNFYDVGYTNSVTLDKRRLQQELR